MAKEYYFTLDQLTEAQRAWNEDALKSPEKYDAIDLSIDCARDQALCLLKFLGADTSDEG